jgi:hypothetical protein
MDSNGAFTADENVDTVIRTEAGRSNMGQDALLVAEGGIEGHAKTPGVSTSETSPLLVRTASSDDNEIFPTSTWTAGSDWDHLPWYKRPSVYKPDLLA